MFSIDEFSVDELKNFMINTEQSIHIDKVIVCKDCEFRFICVNDFKLIESDSGFFIKDAECDYNPYIGKFRGDENFMQVSEEFKRQI